MEVSAIKCFMDIPRVICITQSFLSLTARLKVTKMYSKTHFGTIQFNIFNSNLNQTFFLSLKLVDATNDGHRQCSELLGHCRGKKRTTLRTEKIGKGQDATVLSHIIST